MRKQTFILLLFFLFPAFPGISGENAEKHVPVPASDWRTLFEPEEYGTYINDHCVFQDPEGDWHLIGISSKHGNIFNEVYFAHGVTPSLLEPMKELPKLFDGYPDEKRKYAPHAIKEGDTYHLFAGPGEIRHYISKDGYEWEYAGTAINTGWESLRDTMVIKLDEGKYLQYATDKGNTISVWESEDLYEWKNRRTVFEARYPAPVWPGDFVGSTESPFVMKYGDYYYLSVCLTNYPLYPDPGVYNNTIIVRSKDPYDFGVYTGGNKGQTAEFVTRITAHCAEYIKDENGQWWITSGGWLQFPVHKGKKRGTAAIAKLEWVKEEVAGEAGSMLLQRKVVDGKVMWVEVEREDAEKTIRAHRGVEGGRLLLRIKFGDEWKWIELEPGDEPGTWVEKEKNNFK